MTSLTIVQWATLVVLLTLCAINLYLTSKLRRIRRECESARDRMNRSAHQYDNEVTRLRMRIE